MKTILQDPARGVVSEGEYKGAKFRVGTLSGDRSFSWSTSCNIALRSKGVAEKPRSQAALLANIFSLSSWTCSCWAVDRTTLSEEHMPIRRHSLRRRCSARKSGKRTRVIKSTSASKTCSWRDQLGPGSQELRHSNVSTSLEVMRTGEVQGGG